MDAENPVSRKVASGLGSEEAAKRLARFGPNALKAGTQPLACLADGATGKTAECDR